jgi:hypothetical protein
LDDCAGNAIENFHLIIQSSSFARIFLNIGPRFELTTFKINHRGMSAYQPIPVNIDANILLQGHGRDFIKMAFAVQRCHWLGRRMPKVSTHGTTMTTPPPAICHSASIK